MSAHVFLALVLVCSVADKLGTEIEVLSSAWNDSLPSLNHTRAYFGLAAMDGKLYAAGGGCSDFVAAAMDSVESFDPDIGKWVDKVPLVHRRKFFGLVSLNSKLYAAGGYDSNEAHPTGVVLQSLEVFSEELGKWQLLQPLLVAREGFAFGAFGGKLYAVGGVGGTGSSFSALSSVEVYDPDTDTWVFGPSLPAPRNNMGFATLGDAAFIVGGLGPRFPGDFTATVLSINASGKGWQTNLPSLPTPVEGVGLAAFAGALFAVGGCSQPDVTVANVTVWTPHTSTWTNGPALPHNNIGMGIASIGKRLYVVGGVSEQGVTTPQVLFLSSRATEGLHPSIGEAAAAEKKLGKVAAVEEQSASHRWLVV